jgi:DNA-directed RNA polymerase subunit L/DNA-directed RNA polymerase alpha subunit
MKFSDIQQSSDNRTFTFTLSPIHVAYANVLRRIMMTGVETIAFRADMTKLGTTTDVVVVRNDTPMTNEMLADRIGLLPIHIPEPLKWKTDEYQFILKVSGHKDTVRYVKASDFRVKYHAVSDQPSLAMSGGDNSNEENESNDPNVENGDEEEDENVPSSEMDEKQAPMENESKSADEFFPPNRITNDTCLIATLQPGSGANQQAIEIIAKASRGIGREHARFCATSQCSYIYTPDKDEARRAELFDQWLNITKKVSSQIDPNSDRYKALKREFDTMEVNRCFMKDERGEPYSFDFTVESAGVLSVPYIIERACEVGENMCSRYANVDKTEPPKDLHVRTADAQIIGFDFMFQNQDHTLGNLFQTWIEQNLIDRKDSKVTYVGYAVPHPLRDEMLLRIGVSDGEKKTALSALAAAANGCVELFRQLRNSWRTATGKTAVGDESKKAAPSVRSIRRVPAQAQSSMSRSQKTMVRREDSTTAASAAASADTLPWM